MKNNKGITLVALIITVIILLIITIVAIRIITGDGILDKAKQSTQKWSEAQEREKINMAVNNAFISGYGTVTKPILKNELNNQFQDDWEFKNAEDTEHIIVKIKSSSREYKVECKVYTLGSYGLTESNIGDYISNFNPEEKSIEIEYTQNGGSSVTNNQILSTEANLNWRILGVNEDGGLEIISENPTNQELYLKGRIGYINSEIILRNICYTLYGKSEYSIEARSLRVEDVNSLLGYTPKEGYFWQYGFPDGYEGENMLYRKSVDGKIWEDWQKVTQTSSIYQKFNYPDYSTVISKTNRQITESIQRTYYKYNLGDTKIDNLIKGNGKKFWLNSKTVAPDNNYVIYMVRSVKEGSVDGENLFFSQYSGSGDVQTCSIRPVVSLKPGIQLEIQSTDETTGISTWKIK